MLINYYVCGLWYYLIGEENAVVTEGDGEHRGERGR
jgi:hypothetical protein